MGLRSGRSIRRTIFTTFGQAVDRPQSLLLDTLLIPDKSSKSPFDAAGGFGCGGGRRIAQ